MYLTRIYSVSHMANINNIYTIHIFSRCHVVHPIRRGARAVPWYRLQLKCI